MSRATRRKKSGSRTARDAAQQHRSRVVNQQSAHAFLLRLVVSALFAVSFGTGIVLGARGFEPLAGHFFPPALAVESVAVAGSVNASAHDVAGTLRLSAGTPLLSLDREELARRVTAHPWIRDAQVAVLRPGRILVQVEEREAAAVAVLGSPPSRWLVDTDGTPFLPVPFAESRGLVAIVGITDASPSIADGRLREGVEIVRALQRHGLEEIREVRLGGPMPSELPALRLGDPRDGGPEVLLGSGDLDAKLERLAALLAAPLNEVHEASIIDLRFGDRMVLRSGPPVSTGESASAGGRPRSPWTRSAGDATDRTERG